MQLAKATIGELVGTNETENDLEVQFNPASLRLEVTNSIEGGESRGRQVRQYLGSSSTTLTCDLIFDTADEGETDAPVSVRTKTEILERFLRPKGNTGKKYVTPRVRFHWGDLTFDGVVNSLNIDMDHFAEDGTPLRAKISLSIKEQNPEQELEHIGPGANSGSASAKPGEAGAGGAGFGAASSASAIGSVGLGGGIALSASANVDVALGGESAAEFAARAGLDPSAWRGLDIGSESSLSLSAGLEVGFSADLNISGGLGVTVGVEAGASVSAEAAFGLELDSRVAAVGGVGVSAELAAGFALSAAGGVSAAVEAVQNSKNLAAEEQARTAFKAPAQSTSAVSGTTAARQPSLPSQTRTPLRSTGLPTPATPPPSAAPALPVADERASSFGFGVPLRRSIGAAAIERAAGIAGGTSVKTKINSGDPPETSNPVTPAWVALPTRASARTDKLVARKTSRAACGCGCQH